MRRTTLLLALSAVLVAAGPGRAHAATVRVKPGGLQAALDAAQDGDVLVLRAGTYRGEFKRAGIRSLTIRGQGRVVLERDPGSEDTGRVFEFTNVDGLTLDRLTIRNTDNDAVYLVGCANVTIRRCRLDDCGDSGVEDEDTQGYLIDRCVITRCTWGLATGYDSSATGVRITRTRFAGIRDFAIDLWSSGASIDRCTFTGGTAVGVHFRTGFSGGTVDRCRFTKAGGTAIYAGGSGLTVSGNTISRGSVDGIALAGGGGHTASRNVVQRCSGAGFRVTTAGNTLTKNKASRSGVADLVSTLDPSANTFSGNVFRKTSFP